MNEYNYDQCLSLTAAAKSCGIPLDAFTDMALSKELITLDCWYKARSNRHPEGFNSRARYAGKYIVNAPTLHHGHQDIESGVTYPRQRIHPDAVSIIRKAFSGMSVAARYRLTMDTAVSWGTACRVQGVDAKALSNWLSSHRAPNGKTRFIDGYPQPVGFSHGYFERTGDTFLVTPSGFDWLSMRLPEFRKAGFKGFKAPALRSEGRYTTTANNLL